MSTAPLSPGTIVDGKLTIGAATWARAGAQSYAATDEQGRVVALTVYAPACFSSGLVLERSLRELRQLQSLQSPRVATVLALPATAIVRRGPTLVGGRPIGSGPFAIERVDPVGRQLALRAFDDHFAGRPYLDRLVLTWFDTPDGEARRFETGAAQLSARGVGVFAGARPKYPAAEVEGPAALLVFVGFGRQHAAVTGDRAFRQALLHLSRGPDLDMLQVELRDRMSTFRLRSSLKRSLASSGTNFTLLGSLKMAAATARQISTSKPDQLPLSSGIEKPGRPVLTPHSTASRFTVRLRVRVSYRS